MFKIIKNLKELIPTIVKELKFPSDVIRTAYTMVTNYTSGEAIKIRDEISKKISYFDTNQSNTPENEKLSIEITEVNVSSFTSNIDVHLDGKYSTSPIYNDSYTDYEKFIINTRPGVIYKSKDNLVMHDTYRVYKVDSKGNLTIDKDFSTANNPILYAVSKLYEYGLLSEFQPWVNSYSDNYTELYIQSSSGKLSSLVGLIESSAIFNFDSSGLISLCGICSYTTQQAYIPDEAFCIRGKFRDYVKDVFAAHPELFIKNDGYGFKTEGPKWFFDSFGLDYNSYTNGEQINFDTLI